MTDHEFHEHLATTHASLTRLLEEARAGRFTVGDNIDTRHAAKIQAQVDKIQKALDDINRALGTLSEITHADQAALTT
jgi:hypothetical protein